MRTVHLAAALFAFASCVPTKPTLTDHQQMLISTTPRDFELPTDQAEAAWQRAQVWIARHSPMKIQTVTDVLIETFTPTQGNTWGFSVTRLPHGDYTSFSIRYGCAPFASSNRAHLESQKLAVYVFHGEEI